MFLCYSQTGRTQYGTNLQVQQRTLALNAKVARKNEIRIFLETFVSIAHYYCLKTTRKKKMFIKKSYFCRTVKTL